MDGMGLDGSPGGRGYRGKVLILCTNRTLPVQLILICRNLVFSGLLMFQQRCFNWFLSSYFRGFLNVLNFFEKKNLLNAKKNFQLFGKCTTKCTAEVKHRIIVQGHTLQTFQMNGVLKLAFLWENVLICTKGMLLVQFDRNDINIISIKLYRFLNFDSFKCFELDQSQQWIAKKDAITPNEP